MNKSLPPRKPFGNAAEMGGTIESVANKTEAQIRNANPVRDATLKAQNAAATERLAAVRSSAKPWGM